MSTLNYLYCQLNCLKEICDYETNNTPVTTQVEIHVYDKEEFYPMIMWFESTTERGHGGDGYTEYWYNDFSVIIFWE